jgi:foldase protein PrsA
MKVFSVRLLLCWLLLLFFLPACRDEGSDEGQSGDRPFDEAKVLARIGDQEITEGELQEALTKMRVPQRRQDLRDKILHGLIDARVFSEEARKAGLEEEPEVQEALRKMTEETLAHYFKKKYVDKEAEPSEEEIEKYYLDRKDQFVFPAAVRVQYVMVKDEKEAAGVLKALKEGAPFEELAKEKSIAPPRRKDRGRPEWLIKGKMEPAVEKAALSLEIGQLSDVIKTNKGYQIIKILDRREEKPVTFEEAKEKIRTRLFAPRRKEVINRYYEKADVKIHPEEGVLVRVGDEALTEEFMATILAQATTKGKERKIKEKWIDYFIDTKVFAREARKVNLDKDPEVVAELERRSDQILARAFQKRFMADKVQVSDEEISQYYQAHPEQFRTPEKVRVQAILVKTQEEAESIQKELKEGAYFVDLAIKKSLYPKASRRGGEIGWFARGERDPALEKAAFSMEKGQVSDIIKTAAGYEIIKFIDRKGGDVRPLDKVKEAIRMTLTSQKYEEERQRYYENAGVKIMGA